MCATQVCSRKLVRGFVFFLNPHNFYSIHCHGRKVDAELTDQTELIFQSATFSFLLWPATTVPIPKHEGRFQHRPPWTFMQGCVNCGRKWSVKTVWDGTATVSLSCVTWAELRTVSAADACLLTIVIARLRLEGAQGVHFGQAFPGAVGLRRLLLQRLFGETRIKIHYLS